MTAAKRILVTGSRDWQDPVTIIDALIDEFESKAVLVHGGASGADFMAAKVWTKAGMPAEPHPADWSKGRGAGYERNAEMVALGADVCLAFIRDESKGATHTAELAQKAGIRTIIYRESSS